MVVDRLLVVLLLAASGGTCIMDALDGGMARRAGIMDSIASLGGRGLGRAQLGGQVGVGFGDRGDRGAVELLLGGLGQKSMAYWAATMEPLASTDSSIL